MHFREYDNEIKEFHWSVFLWVKLTITQQLAPNTQQAIFGTNDDPIQWRICAALWEVELSWYYLAWMSNSITLWYADAISYPCYKLDIGLVNILKFKRPHWLICSWNKGSVTFKTTLKACSWLRRIRFWQKFAIISTSADPFLQWIFASRDHKLLTAWCTKQRRLSHIICYVFDYLQ